MEYGHRIGNPGKKKIVAIVTKHKPDDEQDYHWCLPYAYTSRIVSFVGAGALDMEEVANLAHCAYLVARHWEKSKTIEVARATWQTTLTKNKNTMLKMQVYDMSLEGEAPTILVFKELKGYD